MFQFPYSPIQICYSICAEELPDFEYFGTQYSFEVRSIIPGVPPALEFRDMKEK